MRRGFCPRCNALRRGTGASPPSALVSIAPPAPVFRITPRRSTNRRRKPRERKRPSDGPYSRCRIGSLNINARHVGLQPVALLRTFWSIRSKSGRGISQSTEAFSRSNSTAPVDNLTRSGWHTGSPNQRNPSAWQPPPSEMKCETKDPTSQRTRSLTRIYRSALIIKIPPHV